MAPTQTNSQSLPLAREPVSDSRWQLIERILATGPFQKSPNLRGLLSYLAEHSIQGKADSLTERQIGIAVFDKSPDYIPAEDSAARVHVRQLRLRLYEYFAQEGRNEELRAEIPKGSYALNFVEAQREPRAPFIPLPAAPPVTNPPRRSMRRELLLWVAIAAAVACSIGWYHSAQHAYPSVPWPLNRLMRQDRQTRIVVSDGNLSTLRFLTHEEVPLEEYLKPGFRAALLPKNPDQNLMPMVTYLSHSQLTSYPDAAVASVLMKLAGSTGDQVSLTSARDLDQRDLEKGNYIFVGSAISNPWVALFSKKLNFQVVEEGGVGGRMYFLNRNPRPGEQKEYTGLVRTGSDGDDFATISLLPSSIGQGNVMILQGLRQEGTEALGVLLADANDRAKLEKAVHHGSEKSPYFEALIHSRVVAGAPVSIDVVATRTIQP